MKREFTRAEKFLCSWWFFGILVLSQFVIMPVTTTGFAPQDSAAIINHTLGHALIGSLYPYSWIWQTVTIAFLILALVLKGRFRLPFMVFTGISYLLWMVIQNVAVTERYGLSIVTGNVILMGLTAFVWLRDAAKGDTDMRFSGLGGGRWALLAVALFCLWWPLDMRSVTPSFNPALIFTGGSSPAYCAMTPVLLLYLILNKPSTGVLTYRVTAMTGTIIGLWNMASFGNPATVWLGVYHLPLLLISLYGLVDSWRLRKKRYV